MIEFCDEDEVPAPIYNPPLAPTATVTNAVTKDISHKDTKGSTVKGSKPTDHEGVDGAIIIRNMQGMLYQKKVLYYYHYWLYIHVHRLIMILYMDIMCHLYIYV